MAKVKIDFEWSKANDYECGLLGGRRLIIRPLGKARQPTRPLELDTLLALEFEKLDGSPDQCVRFARAFGLLLSQPPKTDGSGEFLEEWQREIEVMRRIVRSADLTRTVKIASLDLILMPGPPGGKPRLVHRPKNLRDAMLVQLAQSLVSDRTTIRQCEQCPVWFEAGGLERRSDARFCSVACKDRAQYKRRAGK